MMDQATLWRVLRRALRVFIVGVIGGMVVTTQSFSQAPDLLALLQAIAVGGIAGGLAALDKFVRDMLSRDPAP